MDRSVLTAGACAVMMLAAPNAKTAALVLAAVAAVVYAQRVTPAVGTTGSRFESTDRILAEVDSDVYVSTSTKRDLRQALAACFDSYIRAMTQPDAVIRRRHLSVYETHRESVLDIVSGFDVAGRGSPGAVGRESPLYGNLLAELTTVFGEIDDVLMRSGHTERRTLFKK